MKEATGAGPDARAMMPEEATADALQADRVLRTVEILVLSLWRREPVPNQKTTVSSRWDSEPLFRRPAQAVRMCTSTVSRPDLARTGHACCRAPPRGHRARWIHLRASKPGDFGTPL
eukprot:scaffold28839_cov35-Phaeocystis_antarctica.AAC.1